MPEEKNDKVVNGKVRQKSFSDKFKDIFLSVDFKAVAKSVITDVALPAAKDTLWKMYDQAGRMMLKNEQLPPGTYRDEYGRTRVRTDYTRPSTVSSTASNIVTNVRTRRVEDFIFESRHDAELVLSRLNQEIMEHDVVSVKDYYRFIGKPTDYTKQRWGWYTMEGAVVVPSGTGYCLKLPDPKVIQ